MAKFYFTFGSGQKNEGYCQPIEAEDYLEAREIMHRFYGNKWGFQYTEEEWTKAKNNPLRMWKMEEELPTI